MDRIGFYNLASCSDGPGVKQAGKVMATFFFEEDIGDLFPYINAVGERTELHENPRLIRFVYKKVWCVLYPDRGLVSPLKDHEHVRQYVGELAEYLASIRQKRDTIRPDPMPFRQVAVPRILALLPGTNCRECGFRSCMAFAAMLSKQLADPLLCPYMGTPDAISFPVKGPQGERVSSLTLPLRPAPLPSKKQPRPNNPAPQSNPVPGNVDLPEPLSERELEVLSMMGEGKTNPEISRDLHISPHTVKSHVVHIFNKLGVNHRTQAVVWAARHGII